MLLSRGGTTGTSLTLNADQDARFSSKHLKLNPVRSISIFARLLAFAVGFLRSLVEQNVPLLAPAAVLPGVPVQP